MVAIAGKQVSPLDAAIIGTGAVMLVDLFLPWYRVSAFGFTASANAFDAGFLAWFPALLIIAVAGLTAARVFSGFQLPSVNPQVGPAALVVGLSSLAFVLLLLRWLTENDFTYVGLYLAMLLALGQAAAGFLKFKESGEALPGRPGTTPPAGGGGYPPPPPAGGGGYPPPPPSV